MKKQIASILLLTIFISCTQKAQQGTELQVQHSDEIRMQYTADNLYMPILDATVNDSLSFKVFFDTGVPSKYFIALDSLKYKLHQDSVSVQIGKQKMYMGIDFVDSKWRNVFTYLGTNTIIVGWEFFDKKVIELSFDNQYIRVYESLPDVAEYTKTKITISPTSHLEIPVEIILQGKSIKETAFIDTGNNSYASFANELVGKYAIDIAGANHGQAATNIGLLSGYSLPVDTIKVGGLPVANQNMRVGFRPKPAGRQLDGLLGVKTLENFSVILDLINYDLYLKPLKVNFTNHLHSR